MTSRFNALSVHFFTATGAVLAMLALLAAVEEKWSIMFVWLLAAFIVDGLDGPLARKFDVKSNAPEYDGVIMDMIVDYMTYIFIPAYALFKHPDLLPGWTGWIVILIIVFASTLYMADTRMKTKDFSFSGFPACWNMLVLVLFALNPHYWAILGIVAVLAIAMFTTLKFIHPIRTERWRAFSLPMALAWTLFAGWAIWVDFDPESWAHWGLIVTSLYLVFAGIFQQLIPERVPKQERS